MLYNKMLHFIKQEFQQMFRNLQIYIPIIKLLQYDQDNVTIKFTNDRLMVL